MVSVSIGSGVASSVVASGLGDSARVTGALTDSVATVPEDAASSTATTAPAAATTRLTDVATAMIWRRCTGDSSFGGRCRTPTIARHALPALEASLKMTSRRIASAAMDPAEPTATARAAADRAGIAIVDGDALDRDQLVALAELFGQVWGRDPAMGPIVSPEILWAASHVGAPVAAAWRGQTLVGGSTGFVGVRDGTPRVHSHLTGVRAEAAGGGIGRALKWYQRAWCLAHGIDTVEWTFDPLVRRNAVINLVHLGARPVGWFDDLYGAMDDARNAGLPTDRLLVRWDLADARVQQAAAGRVAEPRVDGLRRSGAAVVLDADERGAPVLSPSDAPRRLARIPDDIEAIRSRDRELAAAWAAAAREAIGQAMRRGMRVTGFTRDGWYVLAAGGGVTEMA